MDLIKLSLTVTAVVALTACQGQNSFKRESNPVRDYPRVAESIEKGQGVVPYGTKSETDDNSRYACAGPFLITSNSLEGKTVFSFSEGSNLAFTIQILNRLGDEFEANVAGLPEGAEFKLIRKINKNSAQYQLSWAPKTNLLGTQPVFRSSAVLTMKSKMVTERCKTAMSEPLNIIVEKTKDRPGIEISGVPQNEIKFGKDFKFSVDVTDPAATVQRTPVLTIGFDPVDATIESEKLINASEAVDCEKNPTQQNSKWHFDCKFLSSALQKNDEEKLINSGKTAAAVFTVQAKSRTSEKLSNVIKSRVSVVFEKVAPTVATPAPAPVPAPKTTKAKTKTTKTSSQTVSDELNSLGFTQ